MNKHPAMRPHLTTLLIATSLAFANTASAQEPATTPTKTMELAKSGTLVIDVREPEELAQLAYDVPNLVNIPLADVAKRANEIPKDKPVIVVCRSGGRSAEAVAELQKLGYSNLTTLEGGLYAWQEAGMPVKKNGTPPAGCCAGGKANANCTPEQKAAGCCSGAPKAAAPAPADKKTEKKN